MSEGSLDEAIESADLRLGSSQAPVLFVEVPPADSIDEREVDPSGIRSCDETRPSPTKLSPSTTLPTRAHFVTPHPIRRDEDPATKVETELSWGRGSYRLFSPAVENT